jgi:hypothetical protein
MRKTHYSRTGTFGIVFQAITITIIAPIYLTLQLLLSPSIPRQASLLIDPSDLNFLPVSTLISYVLPSIGLCLPLILDISRENKFIAVALWQPFPLYQTALQNAYRLLTGSGQGKAKSKAHVDLRKCREAMRRAYIFIALLTTGVHLSVMATILASWMNLVQTVSGHHILALTSLTDPPTLALLSPPVSAMESREIVVAFLRWDVYCTCLAMAIWSAYQLASAQRTTSVVAIGIESACWALLGGPIFPALMLLWERDELVMGESEIFDSFRKCE